MRKPILSILASAAIKKNLVTQRAGTNPLEAAAGVPLQHMCACVTCTNTVAWDTIFCSPECALRNRMAAAPHPRRSRPYINLKASASYQSFGDNPAIATNFLVPVSYAAGHVIRRSLLSPKPLHNETAHHKLRAQYLTASNIAAVLGANPYRSPLSVLRSYVNPHAQRKGNMFTRRGRDMEPFIANKFVEATAIPCIYDQGMCVSAHHPFIGATFDLLTVAGIPVEIKCLVSRQPGPITELAPFMYWVQCQVQMEVANAPYCYYVEYKEESGPEPEYFSIVRIDRDLPWFTRILPILQAFWAEVCELRSKLKTIS